MYLAPLNYDRFFKKVFSDTKIAKCFLEAFLGVVIDSIELVGTSYKVTDDATVVVFDYRCKINGQFVVIDMQQWYKTDIVKRFYVYHALDSALQLETMTTQVVKIGKDKEYRTKSYDDLKPALTLIWMANDTLGFTEDYISYALFPEQTADFVKNDDLWATKDIEKLEKERQNILSLLNNKTKGLDFLPKNRLIYMFQKNIINNAQLTKYFEWFELAEITLNKNNTKKDFAKFEKNPILMEVMRRINKDSLDSIDYSEIKDFDEFIRNNKWYDDKLRKEAQEEAQEEVRKEAREELRKLRIEMEKSAMLEMQKTREAEMLEMQKTREAEMLEMQKTLKAKMLEVTEKVREEVDNKNKMTVILAFQNGLSLPKIVTITQLPIEKVKEIIKQYKANLNKT